MTKEEFNVFKSKLAELYDKYGNSRDPKDYEKMDKEWIEFVTTFFKQES